MINVLMYHSIGDSPGPTSISPHIFKLQVETLRDCGYQTISLPAFKAWHSAQIAVPEKSIVITFDDGFADFAETAFPILKKHNCTATVFLPTGKIGHTEDWDGAGGSSSRALMNWSQVAELAGEGIDFGGHSVNHANLTKLSEKQVQYEIKQCRDDIGEKLNRAPASFAPPYGKAGARERDVIRQYFDVSLGTRFQRAGRHDDLYDIPRIEMHYFRDPARWRAFLEGRSEWYFVARRALRNIRTLLVPAGAKRER